MLEKQHWPFEWRAEFLKSPAQRTKNGGQPWLPAQGTENNDYAKAVLISSTK